jgi:hypothetical protein
MINLSKDQQWGLESELRRVLEPLANYICATDRPREVLLSAQALLSREVRQTNRLAQAHSGTRHRRGL